MATLAIRELKRCCDFCGLGGEKCVGTSISDERDICKDCAKKAISLFIPDALSVINNSIMNIGAMAKLLLDNDTKTLVKAGFMNTDLSLTETGKTALDAINFLANKAELVKQAQEVIKENEDKK